MSHLPLSIVAFFLVTVFVGLFLVGRATHGSKAVVVGSIVWIFLQAAIALSGFYLNVNTLPPHLTLAIAPPLLLALGIVGTHRGRAFLEGLDMQSCILLHGIRMLVEVTLYWLFLYREVPRLMTFEGGNLDILAGLSAPVIWWAWRSGRLNRRRLLLWNSLALLSVLNALVRALLSAPFRFERFAFDQPMVAILTFPFVLLPAFLVPAVLLGHAAIFRKLAR